MTKVKTAPEIESLTLAALLSRSVALFAERPALGQVDGLPLTYAALGERVHWVSDLLRAQGIQPGDRVAILSESTPHWGVAYFAATTMGAMAVPILPDFHPSEVLNILVKSGARAIFISGRLYQKMEEGLLDGLSAIFLLEDFTLAPSRSTPDLLRETLQEGRKRFLRFSETVRNLAGRPFPPLREEDPASIIYTSGTTGHSKGVVLTHRNIVSNARSTLGIIEMGTEDRMLSILPLSHSYECTLGLVLPLMVGASVHYLDKPPTARVLLPAMAAVKPTVMLSVPLIIEKIYKTRILPQLTASFLKRRLHGIPFLRKRISRIAGRKLVATFGGELRCLCIGGAGLAPDVEQFLREARFPYAIGYGLTETSPLVAGTDQTLTRYLSTGPAIPGVEVRIDAPDPITGTGEIQVRGPSVMQGYYQDPERTAAAFTADGWFRTGDLGLLERDGYLYIKGRLKNLILGPSGENIYPEEIEAVINETEVVLESLVFQREGKLVARVFLDYERLNRDYAAQRLTDAEVRERLEALLEELRQRVNARLSSFSRITRMILQTEDFEKTPTQKIRRMAYQN